MLAVPQVKAIFPHQGLEIVAQVYVDKTLGCLVVELTRRAGDAFKFNTVREDLAQGLDGVISGAADVEAIASRCVGIGSHVSRSHVPILVNYSLCCGWDQGIIVHTRNAEIGTI